jgi:hypothetical protein
VQPLPKLEGQQSPGLLANRLNQRRTTPRWHLDRSCVGASESLSSGRHQKVATSGLHALTFIMNCAGRTFYIYWSGKSQHLERERVVQRSRCLTYLNSLHQSLQHACDGGHALVD